MDSTGFNNKLRSMINKMKDLEGRSEHSEKLALLKNLVRYVYVMGIPSSLTLQCMVQVASTEEMKEQESSFKSFCRYCSQLSSLPIASVIIMPIMADPRWSV